MLNGFSRFDEISHIDEWFFLLFFQTGLGIAIEKIKPFVSDVKSHSRQSGGYKKIF